MTQTNAYHTHFKQLKQLQQQLESTEIRQALQTDQESLRDICQQLSVATLHETLSEEAIAISQDTLCRLITHFPQLTPLISRELLWFLGGECLHYLADEEIDKFQAIEDLLHEAEQNGQHLSREEATAKVLKLH